MSPKRFKCNIFNTRETSEAAGALPKLWLLTNPPYSEKNTSSTA